MSAKDAPDLMRKRLDANSPTNVIDRTLWIKINAVTSAMRDLAVYVNSLPDTKPRRRK